MVCVEFNASSLFSPNYWILEKYDKTNERFCFMCFCSSPTVRPNHLRWRCGPVWAGLGQSGPVQSGSVWASLNGRHLHFLANGGVFLEKKIDIDVKVTGGDAPGHAADHLQRRKPVELYWCDWSSAQGSLGGAS